MIDVYFFSYRAWAKSILISLLAQKQKNWIIQAVYTPEKTDVSFENLGIPNHSISTKDYAIELKKNAILLFYGWSWYIPATLYEKYLCLILHPSPLPKYRGGSPIQNQIIAGETDSAVSIIRCGEQLDGGEIYAQEPFSLAGNLPEIFDSLARAGTKATIEVLDAIAGGSTKPIPQVESRATVAKRRKPAESEITHDELQKSTARQLYNKIRALGDPYPNAYIVGADGKKVYIKSATIDENE